MALEGKQKTVVQTVGVVVLMGALAWASVPFYDWFCRVTGFGGVTQTADAGSDVILDQTIKVRFDASKARGFGWEFKPMQREMELRIGETGLAFYEAYNPTDRPIAGQASYNVTPYEAGGFFSKIDCFCFEEQVLQPGERVEMPVSFFVDPEIVADRDAKYVHTITLSYTFYEIELPEEAKANAQAALDQPRETNLN
ncbi:cytochrome c oxidase assembly protein [Marimonas lutisalis]|uniref:cytochrome c oxidase assembly protein n=1 Tax=Marimonas lutisalis TaxID=2545756 RepID=UPI0010F70FE8|nr:cytochrome c oxidase assembly protein [Marimonas lutisalis]